MGDPDESAEEFCLAIYPRLVGAMSLYCADRFLAEEFAQEAIVRIWEHWPRVSQAVARDAYAHRVAFNVASSFFRRRAAERRARDRMSHAATEQAREVPETMDVRRAIQALPTRQRQAIVLRFYLDLPLSQVATVMGCAEGTAKAHLHKARNALRLFGLGEEEESVEHA